jgi:EAL domain-containing protein (putative c-di-GMP-specific phosphodiesterase class I)
VADRPHEGPRTAPSWLKETGAAVDIPDVTVSAPLSTVIPWPDLGIDGEPELLFQPAVDLATGRLLGFEALLRWNDPVQGRISPKELIPWAEANGYMTALNGWVLSEACAQAVRWRSEIQLAVNCSVFQLRRNEAAAAAAAALEHSGLQPDRLTIEVTETTLADHGAADDLRAISRLGIQLTVDDMGSDWSSLENLRHFAVNTMKIDGSLIDGIDHAGGVNRAIVETIVKVSHSLDLCTVAEAVETAAQVAILRELGADVGQGYFFAPPLAADETLALTDMDLLPIFPLGPPTHNHGKATKELIPEGRVVVDEVVDEEAGVADEGTKPDPDPDPDRDPEKAATATNPATEKAVAEMTVTEKTHTEKTDTEKTRAAGSTKTGSTGRKRRKPAPRRGHAA